MDIELFLNQWHQNNLIFLTFHFTICTDGPGKPIVKPVNAPLAIVAAVGSPTQRHGPQQGKQFIVARDR